MLENVSSQISYSTDWIGNLSLFFQLVAGFLIAYFTISYTQYLREKRDFENGTEWFLAEMSLIQSNLVQIKPEVENQIKTSEENPEKRNYGIFPFPDFSLHSFDYILSHGFVGPLGMETFKTIFLLHHHVHLLHHLSKSYYLILSLPISETTNTAINEYSINTLKNINKEIESINEIFKEFYLPQYPHTYLPSPIKFFKNLPISNRERK